MASYEEAIDVMRVVYVGGISPSVSQEDISRLFANYGPIESIRMPYVKIPNGLSHREQWKYAFITYEIPDAAFLAREAMNGYLLSDRKLIVNSHKDLEKMNKIVNSLIEEANQHFRIYTAPVSPDLTDNELVNLFKTFGEVKEVLLPKNKNGKSLGYAFVTLGSLEAYNVAFETMNKTKMCIRKCITPPFYLEKIAKKVAYQKSVSIFQQPKQVLMQPQSGMNGSASIDKAKMVALQKSFSIYQPKPALVSSSSMDESTSYTDSSTGVQHPTPTSMQHQSSMEGPTSTEKDGKSSAFKMKTKSTSNQLQSSSKHSTSESMTLREEKEKLVRELYDAVDIWAKKYRKLAEDNQKLIKDNQQLINENQKVNKSRTSLMSDVKKQCRDIESLKSKIRELERRNNKEIVDAGIQTLNDTKDNYHDSAKIIRPVSSNDIEDKDEESSNAFLEPKELVTGGAEMVNLVANLSKEKDGRITPLSDSKDSNSTSSRELSPSFINVMKRALITNGDSSDHSVLDDEPKASNSTSIPDNRPVSEMSAVSKGTHYSQEEDELENSEENSDLPPDVFVVDTIMDTKMRGRKRFFYVSWQGYGPDEWSWEPEENLAGARDAVDEFMKKREKQPPKTRGKKRKSDSATDGQSVTPAPTSRKITLKIKRKSQEVPQGSV